MGCSKELSSITARCSEREELTFTRCNWLAAAVDLAFPGFQHVFGLPQHADTFSLKDTGSTDPYRLYNLDVFEYELWNPMALYASIPMMTAHNGKNSVGVFWLNAAEGWVDVKKAGQGLLGSMFSSDQQVDTHWMFESGVLDLFVMHGPAPKDIIRQYSALTGTIPLPPEFAIAYHQVFSVTMMASCQAPEPWNIEMQLLPFWLLTASPSAGGTTMTRTT